MKEETRTKIIVIFSVVASCIFYWLLVVKPSLEPVNPCITQQYPEIKVKHDLLFFPEPTAQKTCLILQCYNDTRANMSMNQLERYSACLNVGGWQ